MPKQEIKIMVSSTVYGFEDRLKQICAAIENYKNPRYKYTVLNSHIGTIFPGDNNEQGCIDAVDECDFFFFFIRERYGSGITHREFNRAVQLNKPRGFLTHYSVSFARQLLAPYMYRSIKHRRKNRTFIFKKTSVFESIKIIEMYNEAIMDGAPGNRRKWAHEFGHIPGDELRFIKTLFKDVDRLKAQIDGTI